MAKFDFCLQAGDPKDPTSLYEACQTCVKDVTNPENIWTAFGCIPLDRPSLFRALIRLGLGLGGGIALIFVLFGAFIIVTSTGQPKKKEMGQQLITSALMGLTFIIFSVAALQLFGIQILRIPGFQ